MSVTHVKLTKAIERLYAGSGIKTIEPVLVKKVEPLIELSSEQLEYLNGGDGQKPEQYKQINSSTGLAVNYYKLLESTGKIQDLIFENQVAIPLARGRYANLDVSYCKDGKLYFVESKFLEPYYSKNEKNSESYLDPSKYAKDTDHVEEWIGLFKQADKFQFYNVSQLCRHLLAIYRFTRKNDSTYAGEPIELQSVIWMITDKFLNGFRGDEKTEMGERIKKIDEEAEDCKILFDDFISKIGWKNMTFDVKHYNDMLCDISSTEKFSEFCKRYFF